MDLTDSAASLRHHLALAGRGDALFADDTVARLHRVANGLPRALKQLRRNTVTAERRRIITGDRRRSIINQRRRYSSSPPVIRRYT